MVGATNLGGVPREQKMLEGHLPRVIYHQVNEYTKGKAANVARCERARAKNRKRRRFTSRRGRDTVLRVVPFGAVLDSRTTTAQNV
jgi:hypothetical protein